MSNLLLSTLRRRVLAPPPPWTPLDAAPSLWWARPDGSNLTVNADGTGGYPADAQQAHRWVDSSGNGRHGVGLNSPALYTTAPLVDLTQLTSGQRYTVGGAGFQPSGALTWAFKGRLRKLPASGQQWLLARFNQGGGAKIGEIWVANTGGFTSFFFRCGATFSSAAHVGSALTLDTREHSWVLVYDGGSPTSTASYQLFLDGALQTLSATGAAWNANDATSFFAGASAGGTPTPCAATTLLCWDRALSAGELSSLHTWMAGFVQGEGPSTWGRPYLWVDGLRASSFFTDTAGTVPAVAGDPVRGWRGHYGTILTQSTAGAEPTRIDPSGGPRARFDGAGDRVTSGQVWSVAGAKTMLVVFRLQSTPSGTTVTRPIQLGTNTRQFMMQVNGPSASIPGLAVGADRTTTGATAVQVPWAPDTALHALAVRYNGGTVTDAASYRANLDGAIPSLSSVGSGFGAFGNQSLGATSAGSNPSPIDLCELIAWDAALSDQDLDAAVAAAKTKWGIP